jgi:hypothetical protein
MFFIHQTSCISPQHTFQQVDLNELTAPVEKKMLAIEPVYEGIPSGILRRMGKVVRMGVGAALPLLKNNAKPDGIIIGTANGGKEDCIKFLCQIIDYNEGLLTPINFVQSTPNAVAAQIGLLTNNHGYNITHSQLGLSFEYALIDADMLLNENPLFSYLLGAVDDISSFNYYFEEKSGWFKKEDISNMPLYNTDTPGSIAGEVATMFWVNGKATGSIAKLLAVETIQQDDEFFIKEKLANFIGQYLQTDEKIDLFLTGENGDNRLEKYYLSCESILGNDVSIARFKHMCGEGPTAMGMGLWLCCDILQKQTIPVHMIKKNSALTSYKNVLIYNNYKGVQHSFILVSLPH